MTLNDRETIRQVEEGLTQLTKHCEILIAHLDKESQALADLNVDAIEALNSEKDETLDSMAATEATLRALLVPIAHRLGRPVDGLLSQGALGEDIRQQRDALGTLQERLAVKNQVVRVRASHGLAFCRSLLGSTPSYGPGGRTMMEPAALRHFHQVL